MSQLHCLLFNIDVINMALNEKSIKPTNYDFIITHCENDQIGHVQLIRHIHVLIFVGKPANIRESCEGIFICN